MMETDELPPGQQVPFTPSASEKLLVRGVYIMGIVLVVLFMVLMGGIIWKIVKKPPPVVDMAPAVTDLGLAEGTTVQSMELDGDRLAINSGTEIIVIDLRKNQVMSRIKLRP